MCGAMAFYCGRSSRMVVNRTLRWCVPCQDTFLLLVLFSLFCVCPCVRVFVCVLKCVGEFDVAPI